MNLRILPEAEDEIQAAAQHYEDSREGLGYEFLTILRAKLVEIAEHPRRFPKDDLARRGREFRFAMLHRFSYRVIFLVRPEELVTFAVARTNRRPGYWIGRRP